MSFMFDNLDVYRRAVDLADRAITLTRDAPREFGFLTGRLNRASVSIAANLAEE
jgi:four helix bundle protein